MSDNVKAAIFLVFLLLGLPVAILLADDWLKRRRFIRQQSKCANTNDFFQLPYRIAFTSTREDLIQAFDAERTAVSGMRRGVRWIIIGMGWAWLLGAVLSMFYSQKSSNGWQPVVWLLLGVAILWNEVFKPFWKRRHIRNTAPIAQGLLLDFTEDGIRIDAQGVGTFNRNWDELDGTTNCDEGILVYFTDGTVDWLPRRVFPNDATQKALYAYLLQRLFGADAEGNGQ